MDSGDDDDNVVDNMGIGIPAIFLIDSFNSVLISIADNANLPMIMIMMIMIMIIMIIIIMTNT